MANLNLQYDLHPNPLSLVKDYHTEEFEVAYRDKGREVKEKVLFFINVRRLTKEEKQIVRNEKYSELAEILTERMENEKNGKSGTLYEAAINWLESDCYASWCAKLAFPLAGLEHCLWFEEKAARAAKAANESPKSYFLLKKDEEQEFINKEQAGLIEFAVRYIEKEKRQEAIFSWIFSYSELFRQVLRKSRIDSHLKKWLVYEDLEKRIEEAGLTTLPTEKF